jgi:hypothetical protein
MWRANALGPAQPFPSEKIERTGPMMLRSGQLIANYSRTLISLTSMTEPPGKTYVLATVSENDRQSGPSIPFIAPDDVKRPQGFH